jgi:hypothetical protein
MSKLHAAAVALSAVLYMPLVHGCASESRAQQQAGETRIFPNSSAAAAYGLETLRKAVGPDNYRELGFASIDELSGARLGSPLHVFFVRLDRLREFSAGADPNPLFTDNRQDHYPVQVGDQARAAIVTEQVPQGWTTVSMGNAGLARQIDRVRKAMPRSGASRPENDALVQVPALGIFFLGNRRTDGSWELTPLVDQPSLQLRAGATMPAGQALAALVPAARAYNGLPM